MNERIRELAEQAFNGIDTGSMLNVKIPKEFIVNFAESIVRECADIALREDHDPYECIKSHFGVK
jgi:hypothetical protein